ncbi:IS110 family transposase [Rhodophyticola sp. CCM32]|uniref:IS110 family transposase n=1 Tax=Rhodophyticola sp. CCM32 TaxID=2916397 RepID=UPI00107F8BDD|nr:IS110 family transposase [Rhodophyticola sp. CCM32]QBY00372.1 IS110 family transposase [Rhodophyticola sp. CCM32]QBY00821.1 IS110 family transposase [Rhodophyticola sp. CCM32]QBY00879.1 IS110 family transposase [Rhodophyticola sp. CCM32]
MNEVSTVGVDLAKNVIQIHGVDCDGNVVVRRQLRRGQFLTFFEERPACLIGIEACSGSHHWGRQRQEMGHAVRLMPPSYVKPYVKRNKTDAADAEAICEAVTRPSMRFVPVKSEADSAALVLHRARDFLVGQVTQTGNAIRAHMAEFGIVTAKGSKRVASLAEELDALPEAARLPLRVLFDQLAETQSRIEQLTDEIKEVHRHNEVSRRLASIPGVGVLTATAIAATTPDVSNFGSARDYAAWLGLTPKQHSTGGKPRSGGISKMGNRYIRRLLYLGAMAQIMVRRRSRHMGTDWLSRKLATKETRVVAIALARRMARTIFALLRDGTSYRPQVGEVPG